MASWIYNGRLVNSGELPLSPHNRAFHYGDGFFETIRIADRKPLWLNDHLDRMSRSFAFLQLTPPFPMEGDRLSKLIAEVAEANGVLAGGRLRVTFFREAEGYYTPLTDKCSYLMQCQPTEYNHYHLNTRGLHVALYNQNLKPAIPLSSLKTLNSLMYVLAGIYARNQGCDDALIMNDYTNIIESTNSNLFLVKGNTIVTPGLDEGCVAGVMRGNLLKVIENHTEYSLRRGNVRVGELEEADEVFLSNTIRGIQWVVGFRQKRYYNKVSGHLLSLLNHHMVQREEF